MSKLLRSVICGLVAVGLLAPTVGVAFADDSSSTRSDEGISAEEKRSLRRKPNSVACRAGILLRRLSLCLMSGILVGLSSGVCSTGYSRPIRMSVK